MRPMVEPRIVPREAHSLSRKEIDPDALKVLYRLRQFDHAAYLVGGSVRDLLLGRRPKDFDIGTSAHPYQVKKLSRNCWIIGRRSRLAHVKFGAKVIEVATLRRQVGAGDEPGPDGGPPPTHPALARAGGEAGGTAGFHDRAAGRRCDSPVPARDRAQLAAASAGGVLQDSARGVVGENVSWPGQRRAARADLRRAPPRRGRTAVAVARRARRVP